MSIIVRRMIVVTEYQDGVVEANETVFYRGTDRRWGDPRDVSQSITDANGEEVGAWVAERLRPEPRSAVPDLSPNHPAMGNLSLEEFDESGYDGPMVNDH